MTDMLRMLMGLRALVSMAFHGASAHWMRLRVHQTADLLNGELDHVGGVVWVSLLKSFAWRAPLSV